MRVVITGASGFLGRAVLKNLTNRGIEAIGLSRRAVPGLLQIHSYADAPGGDVLVHLAEASDRVWVNAQGSAYEEEAVAALHALLAKQYFRFVYASSAVLYGDACNWPRRTEEPVKVIDGYTKVKFSSEQAVLKEGGVVARFSNLYGPAMAEGNVVSTLLKQLEGDAPLMVQDTTPIRDFLWIEDAADAVVKMIQGDAQGIFNVGTAVGTSIKDLAEKILHIAGQDGRPILSARAGKEVSSLFLDISKTTAAFGWRPVTPLSGGLQKLIGLAAG